MNLKGAFKAFAPPIAYSVAARAYRALRGTKQIEAAPAPQYGDLGDYGTYAEAAALCGKAYEQADVLAKTLELTKGIVPGPCLNQLCIRLLAAVQYAIARKNGGPVKIVDFGGALGSNYFFTRHLMQTEQMEWVVVELPETVAVGRQHLAKAELRFEDSLKVAGEADLVVAAGAIQYVPDPYVTLRELQQVAPFLIVDRVPLLDRDRITVQKVHPALFAASFPKWYLSRERFLAALDMRLVMEWDLPGYLAPLDGTPQDLHHGFLFEKQG